MSSVPILLFGIPRICVHPCAEKPFCCSSSTKKPLLWYLRVHFLPRKSACRTPEVIKEEAMVARRKCELLGNYGTRSWPNCTTGGYCMRILCWYVETHLKRHSRLCWILSRSFLVLKLLFHQSIWHLPSIAVKDLVNWLGCLVERLRYVTTVSGWMVKPTV